jgi:phage terminase large subunit
MNPGMRALIVRKTATSLKTTADKTWRTYVVNELLLADGLNYRSADMRYEYQNGSEVQLGGMDKASRIMSSEYDVIYVQEATELAENDWEALTTRLRNGKVSFQQLLADCNPDTPMHWLKQRTDKGQTRSLPTRHEDNPILFRNDGVLTQVGEDYLKKLDALTGVRFLRLRKGQWVAAEGMIYDDFDPGAHMVDKLPENSDSWTRYWAVDFGFTNPMVVQCWAEDPDGRLWLYREWYHTHRTVENMCVEIEQALIWQDTVEGEDGHTEGQWKEAQPQAIICDHDAEGRDVFSSHFGSTTAAYKAVVEGIQAVQERLKENRLFIVRNCVVRRDPDLVDRKRPTCTQEEIPGYIWSDKKQDTPVKEDDHGADAMRYIVADRDLGTHGHGFRGFF